MSGQALILLTRKGRDARGESAMKFTCLIFGILCAASMAAASAEPAAQSHPTSGHKFFEADRSALAAAPIQSRSDFDTYLAEHSASAIHSLSHGGREAFLTSLVFTEKGLGSFNYQVLENELTPTQIQEVLALFGLGELVSQFTNARIETSHDERLLNPAQ
jgi:hypothetical protein